MSFAELLLSLEMGLIYGVVAVGIYLTFRIIDFADLTCDGSFVLGAATSAILLKQGINPWGALLLSAITGGLAGGVTGLLSTRLKVTELLAGILVAFMLYSVNLKVMGGVPNIALLFEETIFTHRNPLLLLCLFTSFLWVGISALLTTDFGLALRSMGQNKRLAVNMGVSVKTMTLVGLMLSNALIALGGALFSQHQGFADVSQGLGTVIVGLAAVMIGERILPFRSPWCMVAAAMVGSLLYRILVAFALHSEWLGLESQDLNLMTGLLVILVMVLPRRRRI